MAYVRTLSFSLQHKYYGLTSAMTTNYFNYIEIAIKMQHYISFLDKLTKSMKQRAVKCSVFPHYRLGHESWTRELDTRVGHESGIDAAYHFWPKE